MSIYRLAQAFFSSAPTEIAASEAMREPSVVHASRGRLRVHLPHWFGTDGEEIVAAVHRLPGVTGVEVNPLTGNVLILFEPEQAAAADLIEALPAVGVKPAVSPALLRGDTERATALGEAIGWHTTVPEQPLGQSQSIVYMTGAGRVVYKTLGWASVGMAVVGAITPGIPTAPFVILAGYFFVRSSPEAHEWLRQSRWFGPFLRDWEEHRAVRRSVRNVAVGLIGASMVLMPFLGMPAPLTLTIMALQAVGLAIVLRLRVVEPVALVKLDPA
jgi:uncharacterized membrane protein YbaN (DUF454 family)